KSLYIIVKGPNHRNLWLLARHRILACVLYAWGLQTRSYTDQHVGGKMEAREIDFLSSMRRVYNHTRGRSFTT
ncbi:hypothetical protein Gohar_021125, partial [Gossypium harknessii]|nr:hypothetical protein [Gossypium harknessii]